MELVRVVVVDVAVARGGDGVDGALALLEAGRGDFGCVCDLLLVRGFFFNKEDRAAVLFSLKGGFAGSAIAGVGLLS